MQNIKDFPNYAVTKDGNIWSYISNKWLKPKTVGRGYKVVNLGGKEKYVHRIVCETFIQNHNNKPQVNHISGDKSDNSIKNLCWVTNSENTKHAYDTGLNNGRSKKAIICVESSVIYESKYHAERDTGIHHSSIQKVLKGKQITAGGFTWRYV